MRFVSYTKQNCSKQTELNILYNTKKLSYFILDIVKMGNS